MEISPKTRILVDCHVFDGFYQGSRTYIEGIYKAYITDKSTHFFMVSCKPEILEQTFGRHPNVTYLKYRSANRFFRLLIDIPLLVRTHRINFAHFQYIVPFIKNCRFVTTTHDILFLDFPQYFPLFYRIKNRILFEWSAKRSDILITVSDYSRERIKKHFGIANIYVTPNAVSDDFFTDFDKIKIQQEVKTKFGLENYWVFVSRREPRKNHYLLLKTFVEKLFYEDYQLVLIGENAIPDSLFDAYYNQLDDVIKQRIFLFDRMTFGDMLLLIKGASLSVYPSLAEGFGIPPLESMALGIPTICSNSTAMADFTFMAEYQFNPQDMEELADSARFALKQTDLTSKAPMIKQLYNWEQSAAIIKGAIDHFMLHSE